MNYLPTKGGYTVHGIMEGPGHHAIGGGSVPVTHRQIEYPKVLVPDDYGLSLNATGQPVKKGRRAPRYESFQQTKRAPGVFPTTIGDMGQAGLGVDSYHEFKPDAGLAEAIALANTQSEAADMPHQWIKPEHMTYTGDKSAESANQYFQNVSQDFQRMKIEKLKAEGYGDEEIKRVLDKERERAIEKAIKNPSNPAALLQANLAKNLPDYLQPDYPDKAEPGSVPAQRNASFYELATGKMTGVQVSKKTRARKMTQAEAARMAEMDKEGHQLDKDFRAAAQSKMRATVSELPTGSGVLDMLRRGGGAGMMFN